MAQDIIDLSDTTFIIPLRIDTIKRLENTLLVVDFLLKNFNTKINIVEASRYNSNLLERLLPESVNYLFVEDFDSIFHRTKYINQMVMQTRTKFVSVWDTDIIVPPEQLIETLKILRAGEADFISPYKEKFFDTSFIMRELYIKTKDISTLKMNVGKMKELYKPKPVGGVFFVNKEKYIEAGMENEKFYGWGREDGDRVNRWNILGYVHIHLEGCLFHLTHERGVNSNFHSPNQNDYKLAEILRILGHSKKELQDEISSWKS
tara:strand:- start:8273 stop:9058 length:786 start_codon:yes stop_codon:yes gene_type:complete